VELDGESVDADAVPAVSDDIRQAARGFDAAEGPATDD